MNNNIELEQVAQINSNFESSGRVYSVDGLSPTINTCGGGQREVKISEDFDDMKDLKNEYADEPIATDHKQYRIRKLTPKECGRLMCIKDKDIDNIAKNQSQSSQYHLYGDSICCFPLMAIFGEMFEIDWKQKVENFYDGINE